MDEVVVTALPHPITTFLLGFMILAMGVLYYEFRKVHTDLNKINQMYLKMNNDIEHISKRFDEKVEEVSKKVDSRVDKAILIFKQKQNK